MTNIVGGPGPGIAVLPGSKPYITNTGVVRWNGSTQNLEVMNGNNWDVLYEPVTTIEFDLETKMLLGWVKQRILEEKRIAEYCEKHPGLKDVKEKYEVMLALVRQEK
jgi:hypothetical protein